MDDERRIILPMGYLCGQQAQTNTTSAKRAEIE